MAYANTTNSTITAVTTPDPDAVRQQIEDNIGASSVGFVGMISCILLLTTILGNKKLRKTYVLVIGLAIGDLSSSLSHTIQGFTKTYRMYTGVYYASMPPQGCLEVPYLFLYVQSIQQEALMVLAMAIERMVALLFPVWYRHYWTKQLSWIIVATVTSLTVLTTIIDYLDEIFIRPSKPYITGSCGLTNTLTVPYGAYLFLLVLICATLSLILSVQCAFYLIIMLGKRLNSKSNYQRTAQDIAHEKKQKQLVRSLVAISTSQFILMVPQTVTWLGKATKWYTINLPNEIQGIGRMGFVLNCAFTPVYFAILNAEFRKALLKTTNKLFHWHRCCHNQVSLVNKGQFSVDAGTSRRGDTVPSTSVLNVTTLA